jgi:hypothetical protein
LISEQRVQAVIAHNGGAGANRNKSKKTRTTSPKNTLYPPRVHTCTITNDNADTR